MSISFSQKVVKMNKIQNMLEIYDQVDFIPEYGIGSRLYDQEGREVIDFAGGIAVNALGHANPGLVAALSAQANKLWHVSNVMYNHPALNLAQKLTDSTCFDRAFFCNSGTEAVEAGLKLARRYTSIKYGSHKHKIVSFINGFHGRTLFAVTVGGQAKYCEGFEPLPPGIIHGVYNDCAGLEGLINDDTAVVVVEAIQAEGGIIQATPEFLIKLRELCDKFNCILMFDEVQTGMGRTAALFAYMHYPVEPDIMSIAKALGCGFPIGALLVKEKFSSGFVMGSHGCTFGGNPLAAAVANTAFDIINTPELLLGVTQRREIFVQKINELNHVFDVYQEIRGAGLLIGMELKHKYHSFSRQIVHLAFKHGVAVLAASPNVTRFAPSLIIPEVDIDEGMRRFAQALDEFVGLH